MKSYIWTYAPYWYANALMEPKETKGCLNNSPNNGFQNDKCMVMQGIGVHFLHQQLIHQIKCSFNIQIPNCNVSFFILYDATQLKMARQIRL